MLTGAMVRRLVLTGAVAFAAALGLAAPAQAHNYYVDSTPGVDATVTSLPAQFEVTTNDNLLELGAGNGGFVMEVVGPDGLYYGDGCVSVAGPTVSMPADLGPAGAYTLTWQVVSTDGHTVAGDVPFTWNPPADFVSAAGGGETPPQCSETGGGAAPVAEPESSGSSGSSDSTASDALWIGGAVLAVALAALATFLLFARKKK